MKNLSIALERFETAGRNMTDLHDAILQLADNWAVVTLLTEYREMVREYDRALNELQPFGIHTHEDALRAIFKEQEENQNI